MVGGQACLGPEKQSVGISTVGAVAQLGER